MKLTLTATETRFAASGLQCQHLSVVDAVLALHRFGIAFHDGDVETWMDFQVGRQGQTIYLDGHMAEVTQMDRSLDLGCFRLRFHQRFLAQREEFVFVDWMIRC